jgi:uncharacterized protein Yka (UPF0111/DUF47 family)
MTEKAKIVAALGETKLGLPTLVNSALAANDRVKYLFTLLQTARNHADHPRASTTTLRQERESCGLDEPAYDRVVEGSRRRGRDAYHIPLSSRILVQVEQNLKAMLAPFEVAGGDVSTSLSQRLERVLNTMPRGQEGQEELSAAAMDAMTSGSREAGDTPHLLVMDMHKALNQLQAAIATESIAGAHVYEIAEDDRSLVAAFMNGVNRTAPLKFEHPGLGTTATRAGDRLVLQNDIGTTDAHVLVIHVLDHSVSVTYTDVHLQRLLFFQSLFERWPVTWEDTRSRQDKSMEDGVYHLSVGSFRAKGRPELEQFLEFLGSRLVFLIDWNRARKRLRQFLQKSESLALLKWAADHDCGHMAWLKAGGEQLVFDALEFAVKGNFRYGEQLHDMLEPGQALQYLKFVCKTCAEGLLAGRPLELIRDEARAELLTYFRSAEQALLDIAAEHAAIVMEIAAGLRDALLKARVAEAVGYFERNAERAKFWENQADAQVNRARTAVKRVEGGEYLQEVVEVADDIADDLEDASFHLSLIDPQPAAELFPPLTTLANLLVQGAQEYVKVLETSRFVHRGGAREDMRDFLEAIHRIMTIEHQTDEAQRRVEKALVQAAVDFKMLFLVSETAKNLEEAADTLMHTALKLRDRVMAKMTGTT